jgi:hypothetical protein
LNTLRGTLRDLQPAVLPRFDVRSRLKPVIAELKKKYEESEATLSSRDADVVVADFTRVAANGEWSSLTNGHWRDVIWIAFKREHGIFELPGFAQRLRDYYFGDVRRRNIRVLIGSYLMNFDAGNPSIRQIAGEIKKVVHQWEWHWKQLSIDFDLFSPDSAPVRLGMRIFHEDKPIAFLASIGLDGEKLNTGLVEAVFEWILENGPIVGNSLDGQEKRLGHLLEWGVDGSSLRYPRLKSQLADAILLPWADRPPSDEIKATILEFLLERLGDPRIHRHKWVGVSDNALRVIKRWLTQVALEQFFQVVDKVADEYMWRFRRAFWSAYYKKDVIDEAWVLFGPQARRYAIPAFQEKGDAFGKLEAGRGVQPNHSVLLLRIGKLTIADWSHAGKCFIWSEGNKSAPKLYEPRYTRAQVVTGSDNEGESHTSSDTLNWQGKIREYIRRRTGISITDDEMTPPKWKRR